MRGRPKSQRPGRKAPAGGKAPGTGLPDKDTTEERPEWGRTLDGIARVAAALAAARAELAELEAARPQPRKAARKLRPVRRVRHATLRRRGARRRLPAGGAR